MDTTKPPETTSSTSDERTRRQAQTLALGVVVVAVGLLWFGVQDASSDPIDSLLGDWRTVNNGTTIAYTEDGKWSAQHGWWGEEPFDRFGEAVATGNIKHEKGSFPGNQIDDLVVRVSGEDNEVSETGAVQIIFNKMGVGLSSVGDQLIKIDNL